MNVDTLLQEFVKLSKEDRLSFVRQALDVNKSMGYSGLRPGIKVQFKARTGHIVEGTVVRVKRVNVEVQAYQNRWGATSITPITWTVAPQLLTVVQ